MLVNYQAGNTIFRVKNEMIIQVSESCKVFGFLVFGRYLKVFKIVRIKGGEKDVNEKKWAEHS